MQLYIPQECQADWEQMTANSDGRFCAQCCKTVVDFTDWDIEDIISYLQVNTGTCGRFKAGDVSDSIPILIQNIWKASVSFTRKVAASIVLFFLLSGYSTPVKAQNTNQTDSIKIQQITVLGGPMIAEKPVVDTTKMYQVNLKKAVRKGRRKKS